MQIQLPAVYYLLLAIALGSIIGFENEYRKQKGAEIFVGLRTAIFITILGYIFSLLYYLTQNAGVFAIGTATILVIATAIYLEKIKVTGSPGATTYASTFIMFFIGMFVGLGYYTYAIVFTVLVAAISMYKREFIEAISRVKESEILAAINLLIITFVILPLFPNAYIGPYNFFNPFEFWLIVATVGAVFFIQYIVLKTSKFGLFLSSILGSLITGTAVSFRLLGMKLKAKKMSDVVIYNVLFSSNLPMVLVQALAIVYFSTLSSALIYSLLPVIIVSLAGLAVIGFIGRNKLNYRTRSTVSPFPIKATLEFAVVFFLIFTFARATQIFIPAFLPVTIFISGIVNVAGAALSLGTLLLAKKLSADYVAYLIGLAISAGVLEKAVLGFISKDRHVRRVIFAGSMILGLAIFASSFIPLYGI